MTRDSAVGKIFRLQRTGDMAEGLRGVSGAERSSREKHMNLRGVFLIWISLYPSE